VLFSSGEALEHGIATVSTSNDKYFGSGKFRKKGKRGRSEEGTKGKREKGARRGGKCLLSVAHTSMSAPQQHHSEHTDNTEALPEAAQQDIKTRMIISLLASGGASYFPFSSTNLPNFHALSRFARCLFKCKHHVKSTGAVIHGLGKDRSASSRTRLSPEQQPPEGAELLSPCRIRSATVSTQPLLAASIAGVLPLRSGLPTRAPC